MIITLLAFLFVFGILVFVHELGHYLSARLFKVRVEEFAFGFPPRIWSKKRGETEYSINAIPLGGYVRLLGEDWKVSKSKDNLMNKKTWQKIIILSAGVVMNFFLAWVLLTGFYAFGGMPIIPNSWEYPGITNDQKIKLVEVAPGKAAEHAGIKNEDILFAVNGETVYRHQEAMNIIDKSLATDEKKPISFTLLRDGKKIDTSVISYKENGNTLLGFGLENTGRIKAKWYLAPIISAREVWHISALTFQGFGEFFGTLFTRLKVSESVGGPVAIFQLSGVAAHMGPAIFIQFIVILSVSLGILNIMPFPALDGGHIVFVIYEKIRGKVIEREIKERVLRWGFGLLLLLVAIVTVNDIIRSGVLNNLMGVFK